MSERKDFPILHGKLIKSMPWAMLAPHEPQALRNHDQSLKVLASRGGLSADEALFILDDRRWSGLSFILPRQKEACDEYTAQREAELIRRVKEWENPA